MNQEAIDRINYLTSKLVEQITESSAHYTRAQSLQKRVDELEAPLDEARSKYDKSEVLEPTEVGGPCVVEAQYVN